MFSIIKVNNFGSEAELPHGSISYRSRSICIIIEDHYNYEACGLYRSCLIHVLEMTIKEPESKSLS